MLVFSRRHVQDAMRELVSAGVLMPDGKTARGINRYLVIKGPPTPDPQTESVHRAVRITRITW